MQDLCKKANLDASSLYISSTSEDKGKCARDVGLQHTTGKRGDVMLGQGELIGAWGLVKRQIIAERKVTLKNAHDF